jgi:hypothetical protein
MSNEVVKAQKELITVDGTELEKWSVDFWVKYWEFKASGEDKLLSEDKVAEKLAIPASTLKYHLDDDNVHEGLNKYRRKNNLPDLLNADDICRKVMQSRKESVALEAVKLVYKREGELVDKAEVEHSGTINLTAYHLAKRKAENEIEGGK